MQLAMADSASWPSYGRDYTNQRFSPLTEVTASTVKQLSLVWHYKTGVVQAFETSPVVVDGTMYITTALSHVIALDAATGAKKWEWVAALGSTIICCIVTTIHRCCSLVLNQTMGRLPVGVTPRLRFPSS